ncbi:MAG: methylmalonyl-CoA mutase family protein [Candidatus Binataceae bacterium]
MDATKSGNGQVITTISGIPLKPVYTPNDIANRDYAREIGDPGSEPYTRGPYPQMYRSRLWRIFQLCGYGLPEDERERIKFLLDHGESGFIMEPDLMTMYGMYDIDSPEVTERREELGMYGAPLLSLREYERALEGIPIEKYYAHPGGVTPICSPYCHACYFSVAEGRGIPLKAIRGTGEGDFFLAYMATPMTKLIPPESALRLNCDLIEFCIENVPGWIPVSVPGTNARETGMNGIQQVAVTFANNIAYIDELLRRGRFGIDDFANGLGGVGFCPHMDFFEDVAIMRAARRMWCKLLKERYGSKDPRSTRLRIHVNVQGSTSTRQQPLNNIIRGTIGMLAAALGGVQSAGVTAFDEAISIPSEQAHVMAVRTQQILQFETGITSVADPLGGSYFVENLTDEVEKRAWDYLKAIEGQGGFIAALKSGWLHREAFREAMDYERKVTSGEVKVVGVNCAQMEEESYKVPVFSSRPGEEVYRVTKERLEQLKKERDAGEAARALDNLRRVLAGTDNVMPAMMRAVKAGLTAGEIGDLEREVLGTWEAPLPL